jgi:hypothetical protein
VLKFGGFGLCKDVVSTNENIKNKANYTFNGKYFENIETIGDFPPIINLKNSIKQENEEEINECLTILKNQ